VKDCGGGVVSGDAWFCDDSRHEDDISRRGT
jgi:hypothetical protein